MDEHARYVLMKDLLNRLEHFDNQRRGAEGTAQRHFARMVERDLGQIRRLCHSVRRDALAAARG